MYSRLNSIDDIAMYVMQVKVVVGEDRELSGHLLSIDGYEGVVKLDRGNINMFEMRYLCKMPKE